MLWNFNIIKPGKCADLQGVADLSPSISVSLLRDVDGIQDFKQGTQGLQIDFFPPLLHLPSTLLL